ncbi:MAG: urate hydroxylase PuuD [Deltaproteobacteria bacterium]|nr:urate hydroxylase PuuD [Deltaproteobacteria bacterium]
MALLTQEGLLFLFRWIHFLAGVTWIGILYYFNFVQGSFFAETDTSTKNGCIQKLVPRALWWFRWGAMLTFISGLLLIGLTVHQAGYEFLSTSWGVLILTGALLGTLMWANVWFVIWPAQKVVIQSTSQVMGGGEAIPQAAAYGAKAGLVSRTNTLFSIPMLFFMGGARHLSVQVGYDMDFLPLVITLGVIILALELNAIVGQLGPMKTVKGVIVSGFALTAVLYGIIEFFV